MIRKNEDKLKKTVLLTGLMLMLFRCSAIPENIQIEPADSKHAPKTAVETEEIDHPVSQDSAATDDPKLRLWENLTLRQKIAQMIMVRVRGDFYNNDNWYRDELRHWIEDDGIGGIITFGGSVHGTFHNIRNFQSWASVPMLVAADYERGTGQWLDGGTLFPPNMAVAATGDSENAYRQGKVTAAEGKALGVHITFSPVLDVNNNPENPIINFRSYSDSPGIVADFGSAFIRGVQENGMIACAKHFPGHGNTAVDSHTSLPVIQGSRSELEQMELLPFHKSVDVGVKMMMIGHLAMPGLDPTNRPATHSPRITRELLRNEWGFDGLIVTDGMEMTGLTKEAWAGESAVRTVLAGADILLLPMDVQQTIDAIEQAVKDGRISEDRINESVTRIWAAKSSQGLFSNTPFPGWENVENNVGIRSHRETAERISRQSVTVVKQTSSLPLKPEKIKKLGHMILSMDDDVKDRLRPFIRDISNTHGNVEQVFINEEVSELRSREVLDRLKACDHVLVTLLVRIRMDKGLATIDDSHAELIRKLNTLNIPTTVVSFGSPYLKDYDFVPTYICTYGYGSVSQYAAADAVWGRINITGKLPVNLNSRYTRGVTGMDVPRRSSAFVPIRDSIDLEAAMSVLDSAVSDKVFPGAQVFISRRGERVFSGGIGNHTYETDAREVDIHSIYDVASLTKVLATTPVVMKLLSRKRIGLDHTVSQYFPQFSGKGREEVTLRHLLTHSSGLKAYERYYLKSGFGREEILNDILNQELESTPGSRMVYSDLGFLLLGAVLEKVSGKSLDHLADTNVFSKLAMEHTCYNPGSRELELIVPTEYDNTVRRGLVHGTVHDENAYIFGGNAAHAGVFSTAEDIGNYAQMLLNKGTFLGTRIFSGWQVQQFTRRQNIPVGSERCLGWDTPSRNGRSSAGDHFSEQAFGHLGFTGTSLWIDPEYEIIIVLLTNRVHPTREKEGIYQVRRRFHNEVMKALMVG